MTVDMIGGAKDSSGSTTGSRKSARIRQRTKQKEAKAAAEETAAEPDAQVGRVVKWCCNVTYMYIYVYPCE